jgi:hypothetical protein
MLLLLLLLLLPMLLQTKVACCGTSWLSWTSMRGEPCRRLYTSTHAAAANKNWQCCETSWLARNE